MDSGWHIVNYGGVRDICIDSSGDVNCPVPSEWTCVLRSPGHDNMELTSRSDFDPFEAAELDSATGIINYRTTNMEGQSVFVEYSYYCTDGINVCHD